MNHLSSILENDKAAQAYHEGMMGVIAPEGKNYLAHQIGMLDRGSFEGPGYWQGDSTPATAQSFLVGQETGGTAMDASSQKLVDAVGSSEGLLQGQAGVGTNFVRPAENAASRDAAHINLGRIPTPDEMVRLGERLDAELPGAAEGSYGFPTHVEDGVVIGFENGSDYKAVQKAVRKIVREELGPDVQINMGSGRGYLGDDAYKPSSYLAAFDELGPKALYRLDRGLRIQAAKQQEFDNMFAELMMRAGAENVAMDTTLGLTRKIIASKGIEGLRQAVKEKRLPAVVFALLLEEIAREDEELSGLFGGPQLPSS